MSRPARDKDGPDTVMEEKGIVRNGGELGLPSGEDVPKGLGVHKDGDKHKEGAVQKDKIISKDGDGNNDRDVSKDEDEHKDGDICEGGKEHKDGNNPDPAPAKDEDVNRVSWEQDESQVSVIWDGSAGDVETETSNVFISLPTLRFR